MHSKSSRTSKMELFAKKVNGQIRLDSDHASLNKQLECNGEDVLPATSLK